MSVLSDRDIVRELSKGILFYPLKPDSIRACDLCLTASEYAYAIGQKQRLTIQTELKTSKPDEEQKFFCIPPRDTALVWTDEAVYLSGYFRGPLYSMVGLVSKGMGHIGTRVNPYWSGVLCIALHNISDEMLRINVRDVNQPIAYLAIEKLSSKSSSNRNTDRPARLDILIGLPNRNEIDDFFNRKEHSWMTGDTDLLRKLMLESEEYKKLKISLHDTLLSILGQDTSAKWAAVAAIGTLLSAIFAGIPLFQRVKTPTPETRTEPNSTVNTPLNK
ncbi:MAG: hypothetical protein PUP90_21910 [Nostoc sp. S4]|nr:hypothetical protein [Nostoc sp. S4]